jgi:hypothetical protein
MGERGVFTFPVPAPFRDRSPSVPPFSLLGPFLGLQEEAAMLLGLRRGVLKRNL